MEKEEQQIKPLQAIKNIEMSLQQLKSKISIIQKEQLRTAQNIQNLFSSAAPIIKKKINQSTETTKMNEKRNSFLIKQKNRNSLVRMHKMHQEQQIISSKVQMNQSKAFQSMHIKQISKKNQQIIAQGRKRVLEQKRNKRKQVKQLQEKSKSKIQEYHLHKMYGFKKQKDQEKRVMLVKIQSTKKKLQMLEKQQKIMVERAQKNKAIFHQLKQVSEYLYRIKPEHFQQISSKMNLSSDQELNDENIEHILYQLQEKIKAGQNNQKNISNPLMNKTGLKCIR